MGSISAEVPGQFTSNVSVGDQVTNNQIIGNVYSLGQHCDVESDCDGTVAWITGKQKVRTNEALFDITPVAVQPPSPGPTVIAGVTRSTPAPSTSAASTPAASPGTTAIAGATPTVDPAEAQNG